MKQTFTAEIVEGANIDELRRQIFNVANEMGFPYCREEPIIKQTRDGKKFLDWDFYTTNMDNLEAIGKF